LNYILFYKGRLPKYLKYSINTILQVDKTSKVFFITDQKIEIVDKRVKVFQIKDLDSKYIKRIYQEDYFSGEQNDLWETSLMRVFYINELVNLENIEEFIHFDLDVLIYKSFEEIKSSFLMNKINITQLTKNFLVFGYLFIPKKHLYNELTEIIFKIFENRFYYEKKYYDTKRLNEMKMLFIAYDKNPELFNLIQVLPNKNISHVFDPGSYGQFLGGTHNKKFSKGFIDSEHIVGSEILKKNIKPATLKNKYGVIKDDTFYELANLHVHSKKLKNFLPQNYKNIISINKV
tara:strand:- start:358 stop:1227 length:870 start_codon:yes stop_codon:yes gene_type:complete